MVALSSDLARLSSLEKIELIGLLWDSIPESEVPVPDFHRRIITERMAELESDDEGMSWEEVKAELERDE